MQCHACGGPMMGSERMPLCPRCRKIAPKSIAPQRRLRAPDAWHSHNIRFTDDELAVTYETERS